MKILQVILCLFMVTVIHAQVRTFVIKKTEPYDTQHVTLAFGTEFPVMPQFNGGKKKYDLAIQIAYQQLISRNVIDENKKPLSEVVENDSVPDADTTQVKFYEGRPLDKARFIQVKTYCDTDGSIIILPQPIPDEYTIIAIAMVRQLPKFVPAYFEGEAVPVYLTIPIRFLNRVSDDPKFSYSSTNMKKFKHTCFFIRWMRRIFHIRYGKRMF